jgi:hypothetical protein
MSQTTQKLDSQFTNGVWRDMHCGDFLEIKESENTGTNIRAATSHESRLML